MVLEYLTGAAAYFICGIGLCYVYLTFSQNQKAESSGSSRKSVQQSRVYVGSKRLLSENGDGSEKQLQLECSAAFSKEWLYATHSARFQKAGDYHSMTVGRYPILVVMDKDNIIRAFHDVCRHRAYRVSRKPTGLALVFGCRYHGWSYDTAGALIRAPEFEKVPTFRCEENGLIPVRLQSSPHGLLFVNFSADSADLDLNADALTNVLPDWISPSAHLIHELEMDGAFNWKMLATTSSKGAADRLPETNVHIFPLARIYWLNTGSCWVSLILEPLLADKTHVRIEVFRAADSTVGSKPDLNAIEKQARQYVQELEQLHREIRDGSANHAALDQSFMNFQSEIDARTSFQMEAERLLGRRVPKVPGQQNVSAQGLADDLFCQQLEQGSDSLPCGKANAEKLAW